MTLALLLAVSSLFQSDGLLRTRDLSVLRAQCVIKAVSFGISITLILPSEFSLALALSWPGRGWDR